MPRLVIGNTNIGGDEYRFYFCYGHVLDYRQWSETHVSSSSNNDGSTSVSSTVYQRSQLWLQPEPGVEDSTEFVDLGLPIRQGQVAGWMACLPPGEDSGPIVYVGNLTTRMEVILSNRLKSVFKKYKLVPLPGYVFPLVLTGLCAAMLYLMALADSAHNGFIANTIGDGIWCEGLGIIAFWIAKWLVKRAMMKDLRTAIVKVLVDYFQNLQAGTQRQAAQAAQAAPPPRVNAAPVNAAPKSAGALLDPSAYENRRLFPGL